MVTVPKSVFVCLKFDPWQEHMLTEIRKRLDIPGVDCPEYAPHITLTGSSFETPAQLAEKIGNKISRLDISKFDFEVHKFGLYPNTSVMSLIPHPHAAMLRWLQFEISRNIMPLNASFEPENWRPHITLVKALQTKELRNAVLVSMAPADWEPFSLTAVAIGIKERSKHEDTYTLDLRD